MPDGPALVNVACEGDTDLPYVEKLVRAAGGHVANRFRTGGKPELRRRIAGYDRAALRGTWFVLADWDREGDCPGALARLWLPNPAVGMVLRFAVHELEAWVRGDRVSFARFLRVPVKAVPTQPEAIHDPKRFIVELAAKSSDSSMKDMVPTRASGRSVGTGYPARIVEFGLLHWDPERARAVCPSLDKAIVRLAAVLRRRPGV